jgi:hypothetical protein
MRIKHTPPSLAIALTLILVGAGPAAFAQFGQSAMAPGGGVVNQAMQGLGTAGLPGWMYYGINAADRGLGYNGSYMTLGGFIPYGEDDLGGLWAADLRSHLSVNGGFFSNVGAVRKQFIGGTLLGVGVYWDYDGDLNQYPVWGQPGTSEFGQFGHVYNQVGVSGEWLTDYGNLRSNGYIPVGTTANTLGAPGNPFTGNYLLCQNGLDTALGGADLEVGAYIPGLADWAGMISVGGYAYGNARYEWQEGSQIGQAVVPWFGGVYTRLDMTFVENWDFSLQANNDSYFDWTGFARLTYRMGGSRRRNVPDQVEQPMMRNEHIVRGHQTPIVATNPETGQAWNVIHVDNTATYGGNGTAAAPVTTLAAAQALAIQPYDIVYVHAGTSAVTPYQSLWQFQADNQILVGQGSTLELNTASCGYRQFFNFPAGSRPVLESTGTAITLRNGALVDNFLIRSAPVGIAGDASLTQPVNVNAVAMTGASPGDAGVVLANVPSGRVNLYNMNLTNVDAPLSIDGGAADFEFQGQIANRDSASPSVAVMNTTGGVVNVNTTTNTLATPVARNGVIAAAYSVTDSQSQAAAAIVIDGTTNTTVRVGQAQITEPAGVGVQINGNTGGTIGLRDVAINQANGDGVVVTSNATTTVSVDGLTIANPGAAGVTVDGNTANSAVTFTDLLVTDAVNQAFTTQGNDATTSVTINGFSSLSSVSDALAAFESNDDATLDVQLVSLRSAVDSGTNGAIVLNGASTGTFTITDLFRVANPTPPPATVPGTEIDDVTNTTGVTLSLPTP